MKTEKFFYVTTSANTRGRRIFAKDARSAKTIYKNITGNIAGMARELDKDSIAPSHRENSPGTIVYVWVWPDGEVLKIPRGKSHRDAVPEEFKGVDPQRMRSGYFKGVIINDRLYVEKNGRDAPSKEQVRKLRIFARDEGLTRGVVIEAMPKA